MTAKLTSTLCFKSLFAAFAANWECYCLGLVFILASLSKSVDRTEAVKALSVFGLDSGVAKGCILGLAILELFLGIQLVCAGERLPYVKIAWLTLVGFSVFLLVVSVQGVQTCGCTGVESIFGVEHAMKVAMIRNVILLWLSSRYIQKHIAEASRAATARRPAITPSGK